MLESFTRETFEPHQGDKFMVRLSDTETLELHLEDIEALRPESSGGTRAPFALHFRAPSGVVVPQRIYTLEHAALGAFELFIVPISRDQRGSRYEAIFT